MLLGKWFIVAFEIERKRKSLALELSISFWGWGVVRKNGEMHVKCCRNCGEEITTKERYQCNHARGDRLTEKRNDCIRVCDNIVKKKSYIYDAHLLSSSSSGLML